MVFQKFWLRVNDQTKLSFILETSSPGSFISLHEREVSRVRRWKAGKEVFIFHLASIRDHCYYHNTFSFWKICLWSAAERRIEEIIFALVGQFRHANCLICEPEQFQMSSKPSTSSQTFLSLIIPFTGAHGPKKLTYLHLNGFNVGKELPRHYKVYGFKSYWSYLEFFWCTYGQLLKLHQQNCFFNWHFFAVVCYAF